MSEPRKWVDETEGDLRGRLFRSGAGDAPPEGARDRALAALGLASMTGAAAPLASGAPPASSSVGWSHARWAKWAMGGGVAGLLLFGLSHLRGKSVASTSASTAVVIDALPSPTVTNDLASPLPPAMPPAVSVNERDPVQALPTTGTTRTALSRPVDADEGLAEELRMVDRARQLITAGDASAGLAALDEYRHRFPRGRLAPESLVLRVEALMARGDRAAAERVVAPFLQAHPQSPYAARLRALVPPASE